VSAVTSDGDPISLAASYDDFPRIEEAFAALLDESLDPRGPASLYDLAASLGLQPGSTVVDVGCGEGHQALALHERFGVDVLGVDPVERHVELARAAATEAGVAAHVAFVLGTAERVPVDDASVDLVWCNEALMYADLDAAFAEVRRVLRPGTGRALVHQVLTGPAMGDAEAEAFWSEVAEARSVRPADLERAIAAAGLVVVERVDFGSEWGEYAQEQRGAGGRRLLHAARLLRDPQRYVDAFGPANYRIMLGDCLWHVYRMIGRLHGAAFVVRAR
jgi:SAM-dependent methyltransferase